jgi:hypothetical protein
MRSCRTSAKSTRKRPKTRSARIHVFEPYAREPQGYARATALVPASCEDEVIGRKQVVRPTQRLCEHPRVQLFHAGGSTVTGFNTFGHFNDRRESTTDSRSQKKLCPPWQPRDDPPV